jgi:hypothetical protein
VICLDHISVDEDAPGHVACIVSTRERLAIQGFAADGAYLAVVADQGTDQARHWFDSLDELVRLVQRIAPRGLHVCTRGQHIDHDADELARLLRAPAPRRLRLVH